MIPRTLGFMDDRERVEILREHASANGIAEELLARARPRCGSTSDRVASPSHEPGAPRRRHRQLLIAAL
jgi:hypothetical protein